VCAQPSQIVCDADLAAAVMAEWAAAAAEAAAVESQLQQSAADAAASEISTAAAAPSSQPGLGAAAASASGAAAVAAQGTLTSAQQVSSSSRQMPLSTAAVSALQQQQAQQDAAAAVLRLPDTVQGAADTGSFEAELLLQQEPSLMGAADLAAVPAAVLQGRLAPQPARTAADGSTAFTSFHQGRNRDLAQVSLTSPFAAVAGCTRAPTTTAAHAAAVSVGIQAAAQPARNRPIPTRGKAVRSSNHRGVVGSAPAAPTGLSNSYSSSSRGSPPVRAAAMAAAAAAAAAEGRQGQRSSLDSRTGAPAAAVMTKPHRRASSPGAAGDEAAATCSNISFSSGTGSGGGGGGPAAPSGTIPGLAGLGGGVGFYGAGCSRRLSSTLSHSTSWSQQQQQQQQPQKSWTGRSVLRPTSPSAALAPPQLLPLQPPPVALPCPAAAPEGLPPFQVSVQTYRLGRYHFKGASAPIAMVEVAASHLTPRRQYLQDPAALPKGPKGGIVEAEQGLVDDVTGVRLSGLAHVYRQQYQERLAAAAAAASAAAAAGAGGGGGAGAERRAAFAMHRFLRNSLQQEQNTGKGSVSSASSAVVGPVGRLSSLLAQSFAAGGSNVSAGRRASGMSTGSSRASRGASDGGGAGAAGGGGGPTAVPLSDS